MERYGLLKTFFLVGLLSQSTLSLKCYICNSMLDVDCGVSPIPQKYLFSCSLENLMKTNSSTGKIHDIYNDLPMNRTNGRISELVSDSKVIANDLLLNSDSEFSFCRKNTYEIPVKDNESKNDKNATITAIIRSCGWIPEGSKQFNKHKRSGCKRFGTTVGEEGSVDVVLTDTCECFEDECNSGNNFNAIHLLTLVLMTILLLGHPHIFFL